jgi:hypothetical protein
MRKEQTSRLNKRKSSQNVPGAGAPNKLPPTGAGAGALPNKPPAAGAGAPNKLPPAAGAVKEVVEK